jgi:hypothetical protein
MVAIAEGILTSVILPKVAISSSQTFGPRIFFGDLKLKSQKEKESKTNHRSKANQNEEGIKQNEEGKKQKAKKEKETLFFGFFC